MVGGEFTHEEDRCTFETLIGRIGLPDKGVRAIAEIVHDLDLKDAKFNRAEAAGVRMMLDGVIATLVGLGLPLLAAWLLAGKLIA